MKTNHKEYVQNLEEVARTSRRLLISQEDDNSRLRIELREALGKVGF